MKRTRKQVQGNNRGAAYSMNVVEIVNEEMQDFSVLRGIDLSAVPATVSECKDNSRQTLVQVQKA